MSMSRIAFDKTVFGGFTFCAASKQDRILFNYVFFSFQNVGAVLDENKDLYMLNPCSQSIWFVVELCEPIQVSAIILFFPHLGVSYFPI